VVWLDGSVETGMLGWCFGWIFGLLTEEKAATDATRLCALWVWTNRRRHCGPRIPWRWRIVPDGCVRMRAGSIVEELDNCGSSGWVWEIGGGKLNSVGCAFGCCFGEIDAVAMLVAFWCGSKVPAFGSCNKGMRCSGDIASVPPISLLH
jgi:hypothetical protein